MRRGVRQDHILVNNAGSARPGDFQKLTDVEWLEDWNLKFFGYVRMARAVLPQMQQQGHGVIVNVIRYRRPDSHRRLYDRRIRRTPRSIIYEGAGERRIEAWRARRGGDPGPIFTDRLRLFTERRAAGADMSEVLRRMTPMGRPGKAEEVADLVMFLALGARSASCPASAAGASRSTGGAESRADRLRRRVLSLSSCARRESLLRVG